MDLGCDYFGVGASPLVSYSGPGQVVNLRVCFFPGDLSFSEELGSAPVVPSFVLVFSSQRLALLLQFGSAFDRKLHNSSIINYICLIIILSFILLFIIISIYFSLT